ncbi:glucose-6-phosphate isomerase family protein [Rhodococcus globerulus]|uniref:glucose-6-phosphate isomerase n=1 Tax=Rhodococcus globerulus TaxID=33008 RepID=A0ABU4C3T6_RHOGO|nr:glucose-6-phosphate isomerase family protein [Rhodococcus globerulus]MDV6270878.1 glucose-6-phosphate isomerase family protein [Rhodococcus globerulus]
MTTVVPPVLMHLRPETGELIGSNGRYEKFIGDLAGLYRDAQAFEGRRDSHDGSPVYWVESSDTQGGEGGLITGISVLEPGTIGEEYYMTRGHLHQKSDRAELYLGLSGKGVMLLDSLDGQSVALEIGPGDAVYVPGHWVHRSVNVGTERMSTLFSYACDAGQDYGIIERAGGMKSLIVIDGDGGWASRPNPDHTGYNL